MRPTHRHRRLAPALAAALGLLALLAVPGVGVASARHHGQSGVSRTRDRNRDGIPDRWERRFHLSTRVNQAHRNQDHEGLNNLQEFRHSTNPRRADTDRDGLTDSQEVEIGDNPRRRDSNGDGTPDGRENAGEVESFDGTTLTIELFAGGTVSGLVTESTEIECAGDGGEAQASEDGTAGDDSGATEEEGADDEVEGGETSCGTADLVAGALVKEAELDVSAEGAVFDSIDLAG
jgi:hypothetical protein